MSEIKERLRNHIFATALQGEAPGSLLNDTPLQSSAILDSLAVLDLVTFIETAYQVHFDIEETGIERFDTIDKIAALIERKRASHPTAG